MKMGCQAWESLKLLNISPIQGMLVCEMKIQDQHFNGMWELTTDDVAEAIMPN